MKFLYLSIASVFSKHLKTDEKRDLILYMFLLI